MRKPLSRIVIQPSGDLVVLDQWSELTSIQAPPTITGVQDLHEAKLPLQVTHAGLHYGEEKFLTSGDPLVAVYFSKCNLRCKDCSNEPTWESTSYSPEALSHLIASYSEKSTSVVSFVSPTLYYKPLCEVMATLKEGPNPMTIIYNCGGYESVESIEAVAAYVDIFQPDFKAITSRGLMERNLPKGYPVQLLRALLQMTRNRPLEFRQGQLLRGTVVRHLLIPEHTDELEPILEALSPFSNNVVINAMNRYYHPSQHRVENVALPNLPNALRSQFRMYLNGQEAIV